MNRDAILLALISAVLFGASTPAAKALLGTIDPTILAGLLYCGAGIGVAVLRYFGHRFLSAPGAGHLWMRVFQAFMAVCVGVGFSGRIVRTVLVLPDMHHTHEHRTEDAKRGSAE